MAEYNLKINKLEEANYFMQILLDECILKCLGVNHARTAQIYANLGDIQLKLNNPTQAINYFEKSFNIFES